MPQESKRNGNGPATPAGPADGNTPPEKQGLLFSRMIPGPSGSFFWIDLRRSGRGRLFLAMSQSTPRADGPDRSGFTRRSVSLDESQLRAFSEASLEIASLLDDLGPQTPGGDVSRADTGGPGRAFRPWTGDEETRLAKWHSEGRPLPEIAGELRRSERAVEFRLRRLGLLADDPAGAGDPSG